MDNTSDFKNERTIVTESSYQQQNRQIEFSGSETTQAASELDFSVDNDVEAVMDRRVGSDEDDSSFLLSNLRFRNPGDKRHYGKCTPFFFYNGEPLCLIGPDCELFRPAWADFNHF